MSNTVLSIREARRRLPDLVKAAANGGEEIRLGAHGQDEATLISSSRLQALRSELAELRRRLAVVQGRPASGAPGPFAALEEALGSGRMGVPLHPEARRLLPGLAIENHLSWEEMSARGNAGQAEPRYRRVPDERR